LGVYKNKSFLFFIKKIVAKIPQIHPTPDAPAKLRLKFRCFKLITAESTTELEKYAKAAGAIQILS
jgi:hypothetical protein